MKKIETKEFGAVKKQFEEWRGKRKERTRIPEELWKIATKEAQEHGINRVSAQLKLNYYALKRRVKPSPPPVETKSAKAKRFVEIPPTSLRRKATCAVEVEDGNGKKLRVEVDGIRFGDVEMLARRLWRENR